MFHLKERAFYRYSITDVSVGRHLPAKMQPVLFLEAGRAGGRVVVHVDVSRQEVLDEFDRHHCQETYRAHECGRYIH